MSMSAPEKHPCPCCGHLVFDEAGAYEICPDCDWEDDVSQLRFATMPCGANKLSLVEAQRRYLSTVRSSGWDDADAAGPERSAKARDALWRPIEDDDIEVATPGVDQGRTYPSTVAELYYWRPEYFRRRPPPASPSVAEVASVIEKLGGSDAAAELAWGIFGLGRPGGNPALWVVRPPSDADPAGDPDGDADRPRS
jgi:hypothetical protein